MSAVSSPGSQGFTDYLLMLRRRWWVVAQSACLFLALAAGLVLVIPETYSSFVVVQVTPTGVERTGQSGRSGEINLQTEAQRVRSMTVAQEAARLLGSAKPPKELAQQVSVTVPDNSTILYLTCEGPTAVEARDCADAFAQAYLDSRTDSALNVVNPQLQALEERIDTVTRQWSAERDPQRKALLFRQLEALTDQLADTGISAANITPGEIITAAALSAEPVDPSPRKYLPSGLALGLLVGVALAIVLERLDRRIHSAGDLSRRLGLDPAFVLPGGGRRTPPLRLLSPRQREGQRFHELAHSLSSTLGDGSHVVMVSTAAPGHGAGAVAANTAAALARIGRHTVFVTADFENGTGHLLFGHRGGPGLAELMLERAAIADVVREYPGGSPLNIICPGLATGPAVDLLQSVKLDQILVQLREKVDYVVVEAPSYALGADAQAIAARADGVMVVVETERTRLDQVTDALHQLDRVEARLLGLVVMPPQRSAPGAAPPRAAGV